MKNTFHPFPRREKMVHSDKKCRGCSLCPRRFNFDVTDRGTTRIKVVRKSLGSSELAMEAKQYLQDSYIFGTIFVKLASDFNLNIYNLASYFRL